MTHSYRTSVQTGVSPKSGQVHILALLASPGVPDGFPCAHWSSKSPDENSLQALVLEKSPKSPAFIEGNSQSPLARRFGRCERLVKITMLSRDGLRPYSPICCALLPRYLVTSI